MASRGFGYFLFSRQPYPSGRNTGVWAEHQTEEHHGVLQLSGRRPRGNLIISDPTSSAFGHSLD